MRRSMKTAIVTLAIVAMAAPCIAMGISISPGMPLGERGFERQLRANPELRTFVALRGYHDWVEEVEVDSGLPLDSHELRIYYLRFDREIAFTQAFILGHPQISLRLFERPITLGDRTRIEEAYLAQDPARRAELAAHHAMVAAEQAERVADAVDRLADQTERFSEQLERDFHRHLRK